MQADMPFADWPGSMVDSALWLKMTPAVLDISIA